MGCSCDLYGKQFVNPGGSAIFFSKPFVRGGPNGTFVVDVLSITTNGSFEVSVHHRTDSGSWSTAGSFSSITTTGVVTKHITGLKKNLRYEFRYGGTPDAGDSVVAATREVYSP